MPHWLVTCSIVIGSHGCEHVCIQSSSESDTCMSVEHQFHMQSSVTTHSMVIWHWIYGLPKAVVTFAMFGLFCSCFNQRVSYMYLHVKCLLTLWMCLYIDKWFIFLFFSPSANRDCKDVVCFSAENFNFLAQKLQLDLHEPPVQQVGNRLNNNSDNAVIQACKYLADALLSSEPLGGMATAWLHCS